ncbi:MAG TPA: hypothetical protein PK961_03705 [bacterium]|nr:hypothetical protein [bacterium]
MRKYVFLTLLMALSVALGLVIMIGCGDDDDDDNDDGGDDDDDGGADSLRAHVVDFQNQDLALQGVLVEALDNVTGEPFDPPIQVTSPEDGWVTLTGFPEGVTQVAIRCSRDDYMDTMQYNFDVGATEEEFLVVAHDTRDIVVGTLGVTLDTTKALGAGGVYWGNPMDENPVGCAEVTADPPVDEVFYFNLSLLPTRDREITTPGSPANGQGINPENGYFVALNMDLGEATFTATSGDASESVTCPRLFANTVVISNVYFPFDNYDENPQMSWCTE